MFRLFLILFTLFALPLAAQVPPFWASEWPATGFSKTSVDCADIIRGGPPRDAATVEAALREAVRHHLDQASQHKEEA